MVALLLSSRVLHWHLVLPMLCSLVACGCLCPPPLSPDALQRHNPCHATLLCCLSATGVCTLAAGRLASTLLPLLLLNTPAVAAAAAPACSGGRTFTMLHLLPQAPCVLAQGGGWAVDFVGAVERIDEDLNRLLDLLERRVRV